MCSPFGAPKPLCKSAGKWHFYIFMYIYINVVGSRKSLLLCGVWDSSLSMLLCVSEAQHGDGCFWLVFTPLSACSLPCRARQRQLQRQLEAVRERQRLALRRNRTLQQQFLQLQAHMDTMAWDSIREMEVPLGKAWSWGFAGGVQEPPGRSQRWKQLHQGPYFRE